MTSEAGSTVPRRQLGRYLRRAREDAGITREAAARELEWSVQKLWRIENGAISMRAIDVRNMCELYQVERELTEALMALARETKAKGWWQSYREAIPQYFELYVGLEAAARCIHQYEPELIPGLLQTEEYVLALSHVFEPGMSEEERQKRVSIKLERQALLKRRLPPPPELHVVLNEHAIRRPIQDHAAMSRQLRRLAEVATAESNISVRVLPLSAGPHSAAAGAFALLDFPDGGANPEPSTVYSEGATGAIYLDKTSEVGTYRDIWLRLNEMTLDEGQSIDLIATVGKEYGT
ncbi:helix-turn-helix domain-containing protein [Actinoplanes sp. NPDC051859]|uniref:helix-turn-helix domain-containing protein n=1 Tax=Actinoplanes sp. NPDC051859 TaxID=3363909 RepID=UPI0037A3FCCB